MMAARFQNSEVPEDDTREWLITYADMITLILAFFIMLLSMSSMNLPKFQETMGAIKTAMSKRSLPEIRSKPTRVVSQVIGLRQRNLINEVNRSLEGSPEGVAVSAQFDRNKILITVGEKAVFAPNQAVLLPGGRKILSNIAKLLKTFSEYDINIRGHTDNRPINTPQFPSNWELSAVRATSTLRFLLSQGLPAYRMTATGLADIDPLAPNDSPKNRALNRRVEFVLEKKR